MIQNHDQGNFICLIRFMCTLLMVPDLFFKTVLDFWRKLQIKALNSDDENLFHINSH